MIGHVERALPSTFTSQWLGQSRSHVDTYEGALWRLIQGHPIGSALESFNQRYAELGSTLSETIREMRQAGLIVDDSELATMWTANADVRGFVIFGDPAVRLFRSNDGGQNKVEVIEPVKINSSAAQGQAATPPDAGKPEGGQNRPLAPQAGPGEHAQSEPAGETSRPTFATSQSTTPVGLPPGSPASVRLEIEPGTGRVILTTQPMPPSAPASASSPDVEFGLFGSSSAFDDLRQRLTTSLSNFVDQLGTAVTNFVADVSILQVKTYTSDGDDNVDYDQRNRKFTGSVHCRAVTAITVDGDTESLVPQRGGELDERLWAMHLAMVERAQVNRTDMIKAVMSAASALLDTLKPA